MLTNRTVGWGVAALFALKIGVLVWNTTVFTGRGYDAEHHVWRVGVRFEASDWAYNPPLYYVPAFDTVERGHPTMQAMKRAVSGREQRVVIRRMQQVNVLWVALTLGLWLFVAVPRLFEDPGRRLLASGAILVLPGWHKLALTPNPDNLHAALAAGCVAAWIWGWRRKSERLHSGQPDTDWAELLLLAALTALVGWTRPFAASTVAVFGLAALHHAARGRGVRNAAFAGRAAAVSTIVALAAGWYVYRYAETGRLGGAYNASAKQIEAQRADFDYGHYFASFYFRDLLAQPNRRVAEPARDSLPTLAYSAVWGDHWLHFFGGTRGRHQRVDQKAWMKRLVFAAALPFSLLLLFRFLLGAVQAARDGWAARRLEPPVVLLAFVVLSAAVFLAWQTTSGLTPGKNSGVKFTYNAHWVAAAIVLAAVPRVGPRALAAWAVYLLVLFGITLPLVVVWQLP